MATGEHEERMSAGKGSFIVNDALAHAKKFDGFLVLEDTVIADLQVDFVAVNVVADYIAAPATAVKAGAFIVPLRDERFTSITLTSGSVALVID